MILKLVFYLHTKLQVKELLNPHNIKEIVEPAKTVQ